MAKKTMQCRLCNATALSRLARANILGKYDVSYWRCDACDFIQTDPPTWLDEAYQSAITDQDIGLVKRNILLSRDLPLIFNWLGVKQTDCVLDFAGGYGMLVRMMRDLGWDFWWQDNYANNLFARFFTANDNESFPVITAFEVFEHFDKPREVLERLLTRTDTVVFSTNLHKAPKDPEQAKIYWRKWWYVMPETGQHVAFYSHKSLKIFAQEHGLQFYSNGHNLHVLTKRTVSGTWPLSGMRGRINRLWGSLIWSRNLGNWHHIERDSQRMASAREKEVIS